MILDSKEILIVVCDYFELEPVRLFMNSREREITLPRQFFYHFARKYTNLTFYKIGGICEDYGRKKKQDHATVIHAVNKINDLITVDKLIRKDYESIEKLLRDNYQKPLDSKIVIDTVDLLEIAKRNNFIIKHSLSV